MNSLITASLLKHSGRTGQATTEAFYGKPYVTAGLFYGTLRRQFFREIDYAILA